MQPQHQPGTLLVVAFPRDLTPCCAREQQALAAKIRHLTALGVTVVALSPVEYPKHEEFVVAHGLTYPLVLDPDRKRLAAYGWVSERTWRGKPYHHVERAALLLDESGARVAEYRPFDLEHELLKVVADLRA